MSFSGYSFTTSIGKCRTIYGLQSTAEIILMEDTYARYLDFCTSFSSTEIHVEAQIIEPGFVVSVIAITMTLANYFIQESLQVGTKW